MAYPKTYYTQSGDPYVVNNAYQEQYASQQGYTTTAPAQAPDTSVVVEDIIAVPDFVRREGNTYYYFYKIPLIEEELYTHYTSEQLYDDAAGVYERDASVEEIIGSSLDFGLIEEISASLGGVRPVDALIDQIKLDALKNPYLLEKEEEGAVNIFGDEVGGTYAALTHYLENLYEGTATSYDTFAAYAPSINALSGDKLTYFKATAFGTDRDDNATLRALEDKSMLEVSGLQLSYGLVDMAEGLTSYLYNARLTGEYDSKMLSEQFRLLAFPELPGYRDPSLLQHIKDTNSDKSLSKAYVNKVNKKLNQILGPDLASGFTKEDINTLTNVYGIKDGEQILEAQLQEIWDASVSDRYKGKNYSIALASLRPVLSKYGNFDELGRDQDFTYQLLQTEDPKEIPKMARKYFLGQGDEGALTRMASGLKGMGFGQIYLNPTITGQG